MENYIHFDKAKTCKVNNDIIESFHRNTDKLLPLSERGSEREKETDRGGAPQTSGKVEGEYKSGNTLF